MDGVISIEGGCVRISGNTWRYVWNDNEGNHLVIFDTPFTPKVGDWIDAGGNFHRRIDWKINHDTSRWIDQPLDETWPE